MAGRFLALPLSFLVPVVLVRKFSVEEFGYYKQLFLIFYVVLPVIDLGISNSLFYFIPKHPDIKDRILSQTFMLQALIAMVLIVIFYVFNNEIGDIFSKNGAAIARYIPLLGLFAILWHFSNILEIVLIIEKKAFLSGTVTFLSDAARSLAAIAVAVAGGDLRDLLLALLTTGLFRSAIMVYYIKKTIRFTLWLNKYTLRSQLAYALPFGLAVIVNTFVQFSHQYIVANSVSVTDFAIYSVGCFQLPALSIIVDSVAKTSLVRMSEIADKEGSSTIISEIIMNSFRKLWIFFFPIFVFLFINAKEFILILFTDRYEASVPVFRIFILMIPLSAILIQHVPRAFGETKFIFFNNILVFISAVSFSYILLDYIGLPGAAAGFITANFIWRIIFLFKCKQILQVPIRALFPAKSMAMVTFTVSLLGGMIYMLKQTIVFNNPLHSFIFSFVIFGIMFTILLLKTPILLPNEKNALLKNMKKLIDLSLAKKIYN